ncbi:MAG: hypothetical protein MUF49_32600 [Oculatellaceae cyanobacterium Prado106]|jgi:hypothetical protein|nr:hypothetical protein [Oculatellaceae cyanobacterium Prado106]
MKLRSLAIASAVSCLSLPLAISAALAQTYMGRAATGEDVYFVSAVFQCGDLPANHECWWRTPMVNYQIGSDDVYASADCATNTFTTVWVRGQVVAENMKPQSQALQLVMDNACSR